MFLLTAANMYSALTPATLASTSQSHHIVARAIRNSNSHTVEYECENGSEFDELNNAWADTVRDEEDREASDNKQDGDNVGSAASITSLLADLEWRFDPLDDREILTPNAPMYDGPAGLPRSVANSFKTLTKCLAVCGGDDT